MSQLLQYYKSFQQSRQQPTSAAAPTFEDLSIDDSLSELQRLTKYVRSSIALQRLVHAKMFANIASEQSFNIVKSQIIPLLTVFANDNEPAIRENFVDQLISFSEFCHRHQEEGYQEILNSILPVVANLLEDNKVEVRYAACSTLAEIAKYIKSEDQGQHVLTIILKLAHQDEKEEMRMTACELLNLLAESLGQELCKQFVIPEVVSLAEDPVFRVRKATALNFHFVCKIGGEHELFERLMPAFVRLSKDDMYRVRRACADSLSEIAKYVSDDIRIGVLVEIFLRLAQDPSKVVRQSVLQQSGMFISTLPPRYVNEVILGQFISMANDPIGDINIDDELKHYCAYSFPAVFLTLGKSKWEELRDLYHKLLQSRNVSVKKTLAASLHEIAKILEDSNQIEDELVTVFEDMIQDVEEVQQEILKNLAVFLSLLPIPCQLSYLPILYDVLHSTNPFNWRLRQALAIQLSDLISLPPKKDVYDMMFPLVLTLLQDPVAEVRKVSYIGVALFVKIIYEQYNDHDDVDDNISVSKNYDIPTPQSTDTSSTFDGEEGSTEDKQEFEEKLLLSPAEQFQNVVQAINSLIVSDTFQLRQLWLELAIELLKSLPRQVFEEFFVEGILKLTIDSVTNVRVSVAVFLTSWGDNMSEHNLEDNSEKSAWFWLLQRRDIQECVRRLSKDDSDVYNHILKLKPLFPELQVEKISCRGMKSPPGGSTPIELIGSNSIEQPIESISEATVAVSKLRIITKTNEEIGARESSSPSSLTSLMTSGVINIACPPKSPAPSSTNNANTPKFGFDIEDIDEHERDHKNEPSATSKDAENMDDDLLETADMGKRH